MDYSEGSEATGAGSVTPVSIATPRGSNLPDLEDAEQMEASWFTGVVTEDWHVAVYGLLALWTAGQATASWMGFWALSAALRFVVAMTIACLVNQRSMVCQCMAGATSFTLTLGTWAVQTVCILPVLVSQGTSRVTAFLTYKCFAATLGSSLSCEQSWGCFDAAWMVWLHCACGRSVSRWGSAACAAWQLPQGPLPDWGYGVIHGRGPQAPGPRYLLARPALQRLNEGLCNVLLEGPHGWAHLSAIAYHGGNRRFGI